MSTPKRTVLLGVLVVTIVITWTLVRAAQKHDAWILGKLSEQFAEDARFDHVHFTVGAGLVSLKGSVAVLEDKRQAATRAGAVDHVRTVTNRVTIDTPRIRDSRLRMQLKHDLRKQGLHGLKLEVRKGIVTVRGTDPSNREQVLTVIASTEGVRAIRDRKTLVE
ncbi:MAG TPA: BON domain-containing protein [Candidatus Sulfotelmatobacter sp.]|nr:BON domain-containing protein [Candidatus Sulfotelmatobacter sp.]